MTAKPESLPGMTEYISRTTIKPFAVKERPVILIGSSPIDMKTIFNNGLLQNVYILYRMFQSMGYQPVLLMSSLPEELPSYMSDLTMLSIETFLKTSIRVTVYVEIAMSVDSMVKEFLNQSGTRVYKLYLGNILNIDIESPMCYPGMYFVHHYIGNVDDVWVSPHYAQHLQYAKSVNHVNIRNENERDSIAPYVWDPCILTNGGARSFEWSPPEKGSEIFLIIEPNISFQKTSIVPLSIIESWYRKVGAAWKGKVVIVNGNRLDVLPYFRDSLASAFDLVKDGRLDMRGRMSIVEILTEFPSAIPICHQWNNEYNYMVLEYFHCLFPVLHNASDWSDYGYYYPNSDIAAGVVQLERTMDHASRKETFKSHARTLAWRHSPYNPDIQNAWAKLLGL
jgi:hypothetical protein